MLIVALVLAVVGLAALVTAVVTSNELIAWVCIAASVIGVLLLIIDALRDRPHPTHLSVGQALEVAARVKSEATYFTHICHDLPQSAESRLPVYTHIAYDGLKLRL